MPLRRRIVSTAVRDVGDRRVRDARPLEVADARRDRWPSAARAQPERHVAHDEPAGVVALEPAHAIREAALGAGQRDERAVARSKTVTRSMRVARPPARRRRRSGSACRRRVPGMPDRHSRPASPRLDRRRDHAVPRLAGAGASRACRPPSRVKSTPRTAICSTRPSNAAVGDRPRCCRRRARTADAPLAGPPVRGRHVLDASCARRTSARRRRRRAW